MDEKLLNALGLRSLDEETLTLLRYGLTEIDGNEGAKILGVVSTKGASQNKCAKFMTTDR